MLKTFQYIGALPQFIGILLLIFIVQPVSGLDTLIIDEHFSQIDIEEFAYLHIEKTNELDFDKVNNLSDSSFLSLKETGLSFPPLKQVYWVRFQIKNRSEADIDLRYQVNHYFINRLQFFSINQSSEVKKSVITGDAFPFHQRPMEHRSFLFPINIKAEETLNCYVYYDKYTEDMTLFGKLFTSKSFEKHDSNSKFYTNAFISFFLLIFLISLVSIIVGRNIIFILLGIYHASASMLLVSKTGYGFQYIWRDWPYLNNIAAFIFWVFMINSLNELTRQFFNTRTDFPICDKILKFFAWSMWFFFCYLFVYQNFIDTIGPYIIQMARVSQIGHVLAILSTCLIVYFAKREKEALLYFLAFFCMLSSTIAYTLYQLDLINVKIDGTWFLFWGYLIDALILIFIFFQRFKRIFVENNQLSKQLGELKLEAAEALIEGQQSERRRWSSELHDGASLRLATAKMRLSQLLEKEMLDKEKIKSILENIGELSESLRNFTHELHPIDLEEQTLEEAIGDLEYSLMEKHKELQFESTYGLDDSKFSTTNQISIYQLIRIITSDVANSELFSQIKLSLKSEEEISRVRIEYFLKNGKRDFSPDIVIEKIDAFLILLSATCKTLENINSAKITINIPHI